MIINIDKQPKFQFLIYLKKIFKFLVILVKKRRFEKRIYHDSLKLKSLFKMGYPELITDSVGNTVCTSCRLCEDICPTKAIDITTANMVNFPSSLETGEAPLKFNLKVDECTKCGLCESVCFINAIKLKSSYKESKVDLVDLSKN